MSKLRLLCGDEISSLGEKQKQKLAEINADCAEQLFYHQDVLHDSAVVCMSAREIPLAFGYLIQPQTYLARNQRPHLPMIHLDLVVRSRVRTATEYQAFLNVYLQLLMYAKSLYNEHPTPRLHLRVWCRNTHKAKRAFFEAEGFQCTASLVHMAKDLEKHVPLRGIYSREGRFMKDEDILESLTEEKFTDEKAMKRYLSYTKEAFGFPDSEGEMRFRMERYGARVFTLDGVSYTTIWPIEKGVFATENVFTRKEFQGKGYGRQLLASLAWKLRKEGCKTAELNVYEDDAPALKLYHKLGYRQQYRILELTIPVKEIEL